MIISHRYKFIFIKTAKTAGTSIEVFLSQHCREYDILTPIWPRVVKHQPKNYKGFWNPIPEIIDNNGRCTKYTLYNFFRREKFFNHIPARIVKARISKKIWNSYFKFCVERNPWDKSLSHYYMNNDRAGGNITIDDYLANGNFCHNYPKYTDSKGSIIVDRVIKYEFLIKELSQIFQSLGIPFDGSLGVNIKSEHRKDTRPYHSVFSQKQAEIIRKAFAHEIQLHNYMFKNETN